MNALAEYTVGFARRNCSVMALYHLSDIGQFIFYIFEHCAGCFVYYMYEIITDNISCYPTW